MLKIFFGFDIWKSYAESSWNPQKKNIEIQNIMHWDQGNAFHEKTPRKSKFSVDWICRLSWTRLLHSPTMVWLDEQFWQFVTGWWICRRKTCSWSWWYAKMFPRIILWFWTYIMKSKSLVNYINTFVLSHLVSRTSGNARNTLRFSNVFRGR